MKDGEKLQIHNWIIEKVEMDGMDYIEVSTISGEFRVMYRIGTMMYSLLSSVTLEDKDSVESLAVVFGNILASSTILDADFHHEVLTSISSYIDRVKNEKLSDEEDKRIVEEEKEKYESMKKEEEDGGTTDND